ncbi:membrane protein insertion efficiency factor YidD [Cellulomonas fimi]|uniref:Putative membrane protein insertion efficiency factor n=2 Tax=Cellulomonas fimi TaxID=1708 RepID=A0A7Y0QI06_CELFI|nr:membrane protein insertion efficiency factor YidD [Cellulomonas fimi]
MSSLPARAVVAALRLYQRLVSPLYGPTCRFYPSCSQYAVVAVQRHGVLRGGRLAAWRLLRCNPWNPGGVDDVPPPREHAHRDHSASDYSASRPPNRLTPNSSTTEPTRATRPSD